MKQVKMFVLVVVALSIPSLFSIGSQRQEKEEWTPITSEEFALEDCSFSPGAPAVVLYREENTDDMKHFRTIHHRIKVLTEQGREYGDVQILYSPKFERLGSIRARTVSPDGAETEFRGQIFDKFVLKSRGVKAFAKAFTLPDVQVGSILEFKYRIDTIRQAIGGHYLIGRLASDTRWVVQHDLPTLRVRFSLRPTWYTRLEPGVYSDPLSLAHMKRFISWVSIGLPDDKAAREDEDGIVRLEMENVPPLEKEALMPPENELKMRVDFFYRYELLDSPEKFWESVGKDWHDEARRFVGRHGDIKRAVRETTGTDDSPETRLRKLYSRVQQVRNLDYEDSAMPAEAKRQEIKENKNVTDVLKRGYGDSWEINALFVALAQAAGFDASLVYLSTRDQFFFNPKLLDSSQLNTSVAAVRVGQEDLFLDPALPYCPFGLLSWEQSGVTGLLPGKEGGVFLDSDPMESSSAVVRRKANLRLGEDGTLQGDLEVVFLGQEALSRRLAAVDLDENSRQRLIQEEVETWLPLESTVEMENAGNNWEASEPELVFRGTIKVPDFAVSTVNRLLFRPAVFQTMQGNPLEHGQRVHPVYFKHARQDIDDVTVEFSESFSVESLPGSQNLNIGAAQFRTVCEEVGNRIRFRREFSRDGVIFPRETYPALRAFFGKVAASDGEQALLRVVESN